MLQIHQLIVGSFQVNCFLLVDEATQQALLIDPGDDPPAILDLLKRSRARLQGIINTHAHLDHVMAIPEIKAATTAPFYLHEAEAPVLTAAPDMIAAWLGRQWGPPPEIDAFLDPQEPLHLGESVLEIRHVPGHSPGSVAFIDHAGQRVWTGDALFAGSIGRTDLPGGNYEQLLQSIRSQLLTLPDDYTIYPGHGPASTIGHERRSNPFLVS